MVLQSQESVEEVVIIGCGLAGLCLALCLHSHSIPCIIYEQRPQPSDQVESTNLFKGGSIALFPNSLSVLDSLGIYNEIHKLGFDLERYIAKNEAFETVRSTDISNIELYGYKVLNNLRETLLRALLGRAQKLGIPIHFNRKFSHVVSESETSESVTFEFVGGEQKTARLLVGADGIYSKIRRGFQDASLPVYHGTVGLSWTVQRDKIRCPTGVEQQGFSEGQDSHDIIGLHTQKGMLIFMPVDAIGNKVRSIINLRAPDRDRDAWEGLSTNKEELLRMLHEIYPDSPDILRSSIEGAEAETSEIFLWPMRTVPLALTWISKGSRVLLIGDAAHGFPPSGGQGAGMAIEDAYTLAFVLSRVGSKSALSSISYPTALQRWQILRRERVNRVADYVDAELKSRLAGARAKDGAKDVTNDSLIWLYGWRPEHWSRSWTDFEQSCTGS